MRGFQATGGSHGPKGSQWQEVPTGSAEQQGDVSSDGLQVRGSTSSAPLGCGPAQHSSVTAEASRVSIRVTLGLGRAQVQNEWLR